MTLTLVNVNPVEPRTIIVQGGGYAEHEITNVTLDSEESVEIGDIAFSILLAPGCGGRIEIRTKRYAHRPTWTFPWDRAS